MLTAGKLFDLSISAARGATSFCANSVTALRNCAKTAARVSIVADGVCERNAPRPAPP